MIFLELKAAVSYKRLDTALTFRRTKPQLEVDFLLDDRIAIEGKGSGRGTPSDLKPLRKIADEIPLALRIPVCQEAEFRRSEDGVEIMPVVECRRQLWGDELL